MEYMRKLFETNFLEYASYVIKERAIPHIIDGLKPVQRRILHSLWENDDGKFNKVANIVGHCMKYHPHGDASIYEALVNIAQKDYFIDKQGNFGNILTGDEASAARYIECRLSSLAKEVLFNPKITDYIPSYDGRNQEPVVLPAKVPVLLMQGAEGIAVGMSTKILPHNFGELLKAQIKILKGENFKIYPDFQQGGVIDVSEYNDGNGKVKIKAIMEEKKGSKSIIIKEIPYGTTTESLISSIEEAARKNKIKIASINDFTTDKIEIEVETARGVSIEETMKGLYAFTDCQISISVNAIVIKENKPVNIGVKEILRYNTEVLVELLKRELKIKLGELEDLLHNKTLEQIFIENRIYKSIEECKTYELVVEAVRTGLNKFKHLFIRDLTIDDIERLLQIPIKKISRYDIEKAKKDMDDIVRDIKKCKANLKGITQYSIDFIQNLYDKYAKKFPRKTKIGTVEVIDKSEAALENVKVCYDKETGYFGTEIKSEDFIVTSDYAKILVISKKGIYKVINVPAREFVDKDVIYFNVFNENLVFSVIYKNLTNKYSFVKRFKIDKFITGKEYRYFSEPGKLDFFSLNEHIKVEVEYVKKPGMKKPTEQFNLDDVMIKGVNTLGNRLSNKEVCKVKSIK
ncbi:DNA topoisomerase IV subunit A [Candidatus Dependentiae bacterium]|nr:DNA topoisomerase IV subunit A [Candidatus Dependentiae bacterium]